MNCEMTDENKYPFVIDGNGRSVESSLLGLANAMENETIWMRNENDVICLSVILTFSMLRIVVMRP